MKDTTFFSHSHRTNFIFHAIHPTTNEIVDFEEFFQMLQEDGEVVGTNKEQELINKLSQICSVEQITVRYLDNTVECMHTVYVPSFPSSLLYTHTYMYVLACMHAHTCTCVFHYCIHTNCD